MMYGSTEVVSRMDKVLDISDRIRHRKRRERLASHHRRVEALQKAVQCASCHLKCGMCGQHLSGTGQCPPILVSHDLALCEPCQEEYGDYLKMTDAGGQRAFFWHNKEWLRLWSAWMEYQRSIRDFRESREFKELISEMET